MSQLMVKRPSGTPARRAGPGRRCCRLPPEHRGDIPGCSCRVDHARGAPSRFRGKSPVGAGGLMRYATRTAGLAVAMTTIALAAGPAPAAGTTWPAGSARPAGAVRAAGDLGSLGAHRIQHVIEIMLENHTYANLFP